MSRLVVLEPLLTTVYSSLLIFVRGFHFVCTLFTLFSLDSLFLMYASLRILRSLLFIPYPWVIFVSYLGVLFIVHTHTPCLRVLVRKNATKRMGRGRDQVPEVSPTHRRDRLL